jgi:hypothetical protein
VVIGVGHPSQALEWPETINVRDLLEEGWRPTPFHEFVVKVCLSACPATRAAIARTVSTDMAAGRERQLWSAASYT